MNNEEKLKKLVAIREKQNSIIVENMPKFERGIIEAGVDKEREVWEELDKVFAKFKISPSVKTHIVSDNKVIGDNTNRPVLACPGLKVNIEYMVVPEDKEGRSGQFSDEVNMKLNELEEEAIAVSNLVVDAEVKEE